MKKRVLIICIFVVVVLLTSACSFRTSREMSTEIGIQSACDLSAGFWVNEAGELEIAIHNNDWSIEETYIGASPFERPEWKEADLDNPGSSDTHMADSHYVILTLKTDGMHSARLCDHTLDQLLYLNEETNRAELIYEAFGTNRILYGNKNLVLLYNGERNALQYISPENGSLLGEQQLDLELIGNRYDFEIDAVEESIKISRYNWYTTAFSSGYEDIYVEMLFK